MTKRVMAAEPYPRHACLSFIPMACSEYGTVWRSRTVITLLSTPHTARQPTVSGIVILREGDTLPLTSVGSYPTSAVGMDLHHA